MWRPDKRRRLQSMLPCRSRHFWRAAACMRASRRKRKTASFPHSTRAIWPQAPSAASQGMFPHAPQLFTAKETVTDDPVGVTYWKVKNGIRLTGMPSFQKALSDQQMWQVSALMASADKLPPDVLRSLLPAAAPADATSSAAGATPATTAAPAIPPPASPSQPK